MESSDTLFKLAGFLLGVMLLLVSGCRSIHGVRGLKSSGLTAQMVDWRGETPANDPGCTVRTAQREGELPTLTWPAHCVIQMRQFADQVEALHLPAARLDLAGAQLYSLSGIERMHGIVELDLSALIVAPPPGETVPKDPISLRPIEGLCELRTLNLADNNLAFVDSSAVLALPQLERLDVTGTRLAEQYSDYTDTIILDLAQLQRMSALTDFRFERVFYRNLEALAELPHLEHVSFSLDWDEGSADLTQPIVVGPPGYKVKDISALAGCTRLRALSLSFSGSKIKLVAKELPPVLASIQISGVEDMQVESWGDLVQIGPDEWRVDVRH